MGRGVEDTLARSGSRPRGTEKLVTKRRQRNIERWDAGLTTPLARSGETPVKFRRGWIAMCSDWFTFPHARDGPVQEYMGRRVSDTLARSGSQPWSTEKGTHRQRNIEIWAWV